MVNLLNKLLTDLTDRFLVNPNRICATGLSMGVGGTWILAMTYPDRFCAIVPMCGAIDPFGARRLKSVPAWYFVGEDDRPSVLASSRKLIDAIRAEGGQVRTTYYPDVGHNCWDRAYADPKLYEWLLQQSLTSRSKEKARPPEKKAGP